MLKLVQPHCSHYRFPYKSYGVKVVYLNILSVLILPYNNLPDDDRRQPLGSPWLLTVSSLPHCVDIQRMLPVTMKVRVLTFYMYSKTLIYQTL